MPHGYFAHMQGTVVVPQALGVVPDSTDKSFLLLFFKKEALSSAFSLAPRSRSANVPFFETSRNFLIRNYRVL